MNVVPLAAITVRDNRLRRELPEDKTVELAESIWKLGLLQPIVLEDDGEHLLCGERRFRAMEKLISDKEMTKSFETLYGSPHPAAQILIGGESIKAITYSELNEEQKIEAELEENTRRLDLTWQEQARATKRLHDLRQSQHGEGGRGLDGWSIKDTAEEITGRKPTSAEQTKVSEELILAEFLDDPLVANAPDPREAMKVLRKLADAKRRKEKADAISLDDLKHTVLLGNSYEVLDDPKWRDSFDVIVTDPPYGRDVHKQTWDGEQHDYDDSRAAWTTFLEKFPSTSAFVSRSQAHLYVFMDQRNFNEAFVAFELVGWNVWPYPFIWDKGNVGSYGNAEFGPRHCYDIVLYAHKGRKPCVAMYRDVINITQQTGLSHPAGKPVEVYEDLLKRSVVAGDHVLDAFVGGGTFFNACDKMKVIGTGIEIDPKYYHMAVARAAGEKK